MSPIRIGLSLVSSAFLASACATDDQKSDSAAAAATIAETAAASAAPPGQAITRPSAKSADHEFLRMMADHHEGLIHMASAAMSRATRTESQEDAHKLHTKQFAEQRRMVAIIQAQYGETLAPAILPSSRAMIDSLAPKSGADYERTFYRNVIAHHREGIRMIDAALARLTNPETKALAAKMKADQEKEIRELSPKASV